MLAVGEAVANAIEHAYLGQPAGTVDVRGGIETTPCGQRRATITVRDHGRWRPTPIPHENRRRGIPLMRACVDTVTIGQPTTTRWAPEWCCAAKPYPHRRNTADATDPGHLTLPAGTCPQAAVPSSQPLISSRWRCQGWP